MVQALLKVAHSALTFQAELSETELQKRLQIQSRTFKLHKRRPYLFKQENIGKKYDISWDKLWKQTSVLQQPLRQPATETQSAEQSIYPKQNYESFFCSELLAAAYKACGLISVDKSCSQFWPVTFSDKERIDFLKGAKLEPELVINFSLSTNS